MFNYNSFIANQAPQTPQIVAATAAQARADEEAQARVSALRSKNAIGAGRIGTEMYDRGMFSKDVAAAPMDGSPFTMPTSDAGLSMAVDAPVSATPFAAPDPMSALSTAANAPVGVESLAANFGADAAGSVAADAATTKAAEAVGAKTATSGLGSMLGAGAGKMTALAAANPVTASIMTALALREMFK
jgi:hypothetical protein